MTVARLIHEDMALLREIMGMGGPVFTGRRPETPEQRERRHTDRSVLYVEVARRALLRGIDGLKPEVVFDRPAHLPDDNGELAWHLRAASLPRAPKSAKDVAADWYSFRDHVLSAERKDEGSVIALLRQIGECERAPGGIGDETGHVFRTFVRKHYTRAEIPVPLPRETEPEWSRLVTSLVRRVDVIPDWLVYFPWHGRPPRGTKLRMPGGPESSASTTTHHDRTEPNRDDQSEIAF